MSSSVDESILPVEETVAHKTDVLDWSQVAAECCDLEFRPNARFGFGTTTMVLAQLAIQMALVSLAAWAVSRSVGLSITPLLDRGELAALSVAIGVAWAIVAEARRRIDPEDDQSPAIEPATLAKAFLPVLSWQAVTLTAKLDQLAVAFLYYPMVTLPVAVLVFDRLATHAVHWMTASPRTDHAAKIAGRDLWASRVLGRSGNRNRQASGVEADANSSLLEAQQTTHGYRWGFLWILQAFLVPAVIVIFTNSGATAPTVGLQLVTGISFGLLVAVLLRSGGDVRIIGRFFQMLVHWFYYGWRDRLPPWVFHSPCGGWPKRQLIMLLLVTVISIPVTSLAAHSFSALVTSADSASSPAATPSLSADSVGAARSSRVSAAWSWLWVAPTVLVAVFLPTLDFCLVGLLLTGKIISAYYDAFEAPSDFASPPDHASQEPGATEPPVTTPTSHEGPSNHAQ